MRKVTGSRSPRRPGVVEIDMLRFQVSEGEALVEARSAIDNNIVAMFERREWRQLLRWLERVDYWRTRELMRGRK